MEELRTRAQSADPPDSVISAYEKASRFGRRSISKDDSPENILSRMLPSSTPLSLIIDGLDELEDPENAIKPLLELASRTDKTRIAFFSREMPEIQRLLSSAPRIRISQNDTQTDIKTYVRGSSDFVPLESHAAREQIIEEICFKADGMFLWARIVLEDIAKTTNLATLREVLHCCPSGLQPVYSHFLNRLTSQGPHRSKLARDILQWVCCTARPLTIDELETALATRVQTGRVPDSERAFRSSILNICGPFIVFSAKDNLVQPVHHSFREFLLSSAANGSLGDDARILLINEKHTHAQLASRCLRYLELQISDCLDSNWSADSLDSFGTYSLGFWCHHTISGSFSEALEHQICSFMSRTENRQAWLYWMFFHSQEAFSLQRIFRLHQLLRDWSQPEGREKESMLATTMSDWSMDALQLVLNCQEDAAKATYFGKMMIIRDLVRRMKQTNQLSQAVAMLETLRMSVKGQQKAEAVHLALLLNILGILYDQQGCTELSLDTHTKAHTIQNHHLGEFHPKTLWTSNEIGRMYRHMGLLEKSEQSHRSVMAVITRTLPDDHPELIWTVNTLANTLRKMNFPQEALELHVKAYRARVKSFGELHTHTLWSCGDVAKCYRELGDLPEALDWSLKALDGRIELLGYEHPDTLWSMNDVGIVLSAMGRYSDAYRTHVDALESQERVLGKCHEHVQWTRSVVEDLQGKCASVPGPNLQ